LPREPAMMQHMMDGSGMMWGMALGGLIALALLVLVIAALVKYVFFR
jgi:Ca2+/Na+ antiporter